MTKTPQVSMAYHNRSWILTHATVWCRCLADSFPKGGQGSSTVHLVVLLTATGSGILYWSLCIHLADRGRDREHVDLCGRSYRPGLEVVVFNSAHIPLAGTQLYDHTWLQGMLGNVVKLCTQKVKGNGLVNNQSLNTFTENLFLNLLVEWRASTLSSP